MQNISGTWLVDNRLEILHKGEPLALKELDLVRVELRN